MEKRQYILCRKKPSKMGGQYVITIPKNLITSGAIDLEQEYEFIAKEV